MITTNDGRRLRKIIDLLCHLSLYILPASVHTPHYCKNNRRGRWLNDGRYNPLTSGMIVIILTR